jgi:hypothetical protein
MNDTIQESLNDTPIKKQRGRPAKANTISTTLDEPRKSLALSLRDEPSQSRDLSQSQASNSMELDKMERKMRAPRNINRTASTKSKQLTASKIAEARKKENDTKYKSELQTYLKERLKQGKAKVKLEATIKKLEDKLKSL